jgi:hypothetical protein
MAAKFDKLNGTMNVWNAGVNWLIKSHSSKLTFDYQLRPVFKADADGLSPDGNKGQVVLQYQVYF